MYKKDAKRIIKKFYKDNGLNTRGYKTIDIKIHDWKSCEYVLIFHIGQWTEEKALNLYDYDAYIVDKDEKIVYDESNGEMIMSDVLRMFDQLVTQFD